MRDKQSPRLRTYVKEQNEYFRARTAGLKTLKETLFQELKSRVNETDMSVPTRMDGFWYFTRIQQGGQYAVQCRLPISGPDDWNPPKVAATDAPGSMPGEEVVFDPNIESKGHEFFRLGGLDLSKDGRWLLYGVDVTGDERYDFHIRDLRDGTELPEVLKGIAGACFTPDGRWIFYTLLDEAWRPNAVMRHRVGAPVGEDVEVFLEPDERFWVGVGMSFDERHIVIGSSSKTTSEVLMLPVETPDGEFRAFIPRQEGIEYDVSFARFEGAGPDGVDIPLALVYHNANNPNFEIDVVNLDAHEPPYRLGEGTVVAVGSPYGCERGDEAEAGAGAKRVDTPWMCDGNPAVLQGARGLGIEGIAMHKNFVVLSYRAGGLPHVAVMTKEQAAKDFLAGRPWSFRELVPGVGMVDAVAGGVHNAHGSSDGNGAHLYSISVGGNPSYEAPRMRYTFSSYTTPGQLHELDPGTGHDTLLKEVKVLGDFDSADYRERRVWVTVRDGERVPASLVWRADRCERMREFGNDSCGDEAPSLTLEGRWLSGDKQGDEAQASAIFSSEPVTEPSAKITPAPMFITGYGAYEVSSDPGFSVARLSMLDRGVLYVVAHVRGGGEMGRAWYEQGRRLNKKHTFEDFVDVTRAVENAGLADPKRAVANGGSAGGLLMGAIANMAPECYAGVEADVPFVDALTSILDPSLPLTVTEWDEWGDPLHDKRVYDYMKSYTPYENAPFGPWQGNGDENGHDDEISSDEANKANEFPRIFATTSMNDTRVLYVEPLKWIARLQSQGVDAMARIEVEAGHGGASGRYHQWREVSEENAWCLSVMGITE
ncbi:prolyl oligopeptidase family serine peptidase [Bifidobacterium sp. ESL0790]|uniref:S9 family peptidase n=1 Tax=Bifidobacterium sp. ESL0790 TaxID=2983233 RepID=UPI0023F8E87A|nr:prolyl oligopeptidase family serine peptidase [Bifidobacterium sp. ESL0790]WEV73241.1 prolyl oligopeptidase family serine peptidase [Bifidobacterium sp. ESL0790]